jgi:starch-binding outer membrane protein, SusD/RagB family
MSETYIRAAGGYSPLLGRRLNRWRAVAIMGGAALVGATACKDSAVPYFDAPTNLPASPTGLQNAVTGLFSATRVDVNWDVWYAGSFGRDIFWFLGASSNVLVDVAGLTAPTSHSDIQAVEEWDNEYAQAKQANNIIASLANVPAYSAAQVAAVSGVAQTIKALNFMMLAETRDSIGIPIYSIGSNRTDPPYCIKDVWAYIVALLDSGFADLNAAGSVSLPVKLPAGFASVGQTASPSTTPGSFAAFNRALAGKAGLEYAYAIARNSPGTHPTPTTPGSPDPGALARADSALTASALYNPSVIAPPVAGNFALDAFGVYHTFSGQSGDLQNAVLQYYYLFDATWDLYYDVDTADLRYKNKFVPDPFPVQLSQYAGVSNALNYLPYAQVNSPFPIVRAEELALVRAQIQLGMGNFANAITLINQVHMQAGGFATPLAIAPTYTAVRDSLLKEQRISTVFEPSNDRMIALRMYNLEAVADTTWQATAGPDAPTAAAFGSTDFHQTVANVPLVEVTSRGGWNLTCP